MPSHAILLSDVHVGVTPYGERVRIGGTMEFSGINNRLDRRRIDAIVTGARQTLMPWQTPEIEDEWAGMRPITADGLPILDRAGAFDNTFIATGYAMQGVTLAPTVRARAGRVDRDRESAGDARAVPARPLRARPAAHRRALAQARGSRVTKLRVAIIGSGNIGTDLMMKIARSPSLELVGVAGIDPESDGLRKARERGITVSARRSRWPARAGRGRSTSRSMRPRRARTRSTRGCWPRAASAAST